MEERKVGLKAITGKPIPGRFTSCIELVAERLSTGIEFGLPADTLFTIEATRSGAASYF